MSMFLNYQDLADNYIPNNLIKKFPLKPSQSKLDPTINSKPYEQYNKKNELVGYFWRYGDTLNLEFNLDGEITVESDSIIFKAINQVPTEETKGKIGQRAYNIVDFKSWTCTSIVNDTYTWTLDEEFTYPEFGESIFLDASTYLKDKNIKINIYNFRHEVVAEKVFAGKTNVVFQIDEELSKKLVKGIYYCSLNVYNQLSNIRVFDGEDCKLLVK